MKNIRGVSPATTSIENSVSSMQNGEYSESDHNFVTQDLNLEEEEERDDDDEEATKEDTASSPSKGKEIQHCCQNT